MKTHHLSIFTLFVVILTLLLQVCMLSISFAAESVRVDQDEIFVATQGDKNVTVQILVKNQGTEGIQVKGVLDGISGITVTAGTNLTNISAGESQYMSFKLDIDDGAEGDYKLPFQLWDASGNNSLAKSTIEITVYKRTNSDSDSSEYVPSVELNYIVSGNEIVTANDNTIITLSVYNRGNTILKGAKVTIAVPEGFSIAKNTNVCNIGNISVGSKQSGSFTLTADQNVETKTYPVTLTLSGIDQANSPYSTEQTFYIKAKGAEVTQSLGDLEIKNVTIPSQVDENASFNLEFDVVNSTSMTVESIRVNAEIPDGLISETKNSFTVTSLAPGSSHHFSISLISKKNIEKGFYSIKITAVSSKEKNSVAVEQYAGTFVNVKEKEDDNNTSGSAIHTPELIVSNYTYGGSYVPAGSKFPLSLTLTNTSKSVNMSNIKVTVSSEDGTFTPAGSSNSFYIQSLAANSGTIKTLTMTTKIDAEQKTSSIKVNTTYEDDHGNAFESSDIISIPVMQDERLMIDEIVPPTELYSGTTASSSVSFSNMGKTTLNSLQIDVSGDFTSDASNMYYVGNLESGKSDSFDFSFTPASSGEMNGLITFTYENSSGEEFKIERPFQFDVMDAYAADEDQGEKNPEEKAQPHYGIIASVVVLILVLLLLLRLLRRMKNKKTSQSDSGESEYYTDDFEYDTDVSDPDTSDSMYDTDGSDSDTSDSMYDPDDSDSDSDLDSDSDD